MYVEVEGEVIRIISAWPATREERSAYERSEREGGRILRAGAREKDSNDGMGGYRWRRNPYAASLARTGIRILASALPPGSRTTEDWRARRTRIPPKGGR